MGTPGWTGSTSGAGICHGELALDTALAKVRLIQLGSEDDVKAPKGAANERFRCWRLEAEVAHRFLAELINL